MTAATDIPDDETLSLIVQRPEIPRRGGPEGGRSPAGVPRTG